MKDLKQTPPGSSDPTKELAKSGYINELLKSSGYLDPKHQYYEQAQQMINLAKAAASGHLAAATSIRQRPQTQPFTPTHDVPSFYGSGPGQAPDAARTVTRGSIREYQQPVRSDALPPAGFNPRQYRAPVGTVIPRRPSSSATSGVRLPPPIPGVPTRRTPRALDESPQALSGGDASRALPPAQTRVPAPPPHLLRGLPIDRPSADTAQILPNVKKRIQFVVSPEPQPLAPSHANNPYDPNNTSEQGYPPVKEEVFAVPSRREINEELKKEEQKAYWKNRDVRTLIDPTTNYVKEKGPGSGHFEKYERRGNPSAYFASKDKGTTQYGAQQMRGAKTAHTRGAKFGETVPESRLTQEQVAIDAKYRAAAERILFLVQDSGQIPTILGKNTQTKLQSLMLVEEPDYTAFKYQHPINTEKLAAALKRDYPTLEALGTVIEFKEGAPIRPRR